MCKSGFFRELIQNGADAIRARKTLENPEIPYWENDYGDIVISFEEKDGEHWISFTDNGVGMSEAVLTGPFLDFGQSFWNTPLMNREWPGLASKGFHSTGQYGIGFFSVFMWSDTVRVITRRYDKSWEDTLALVFKEGANSRPVLRKGTQEEQRIVRDGGTKVSVKISEELYQKIQNSQILDKRINVPLKKTLAMMCPCLDCNLSLDNRKGTVIKANDWLTIAPLALIERISLDYHYDSNSTRRYSRATKMEILSQNMDIVWDGLIPVGRAFVSTDNIGSAPFSAATTDGFLSSNGAFPYLGGILCGTSSKVSRDSTTINLQALEPWAKRQYEKFKQMGLDPDFQQQMAVIFCSYGVFPDDSCVVIINGKPSNFRDISRHIKETQLDYYVIGYTSDFSKGHSSLVLPREKVLVSTIYSSYAANWPTHHEINYLGSLFQTVMEAYSIPENRQDRHIITEHDEIASFLNCGEKTPTIKEGRKLRELIIEAVITHDEIPPKEEES